MKKLVGVLLTVAVAVSLMAMPAVTSADGTNVTIVLGNDVAVAVGASGTTNASHIGSGCWEAVKGQKTEFYIATTVAPFSSLGSLTIDDIDSISYWTNKPVKTADFYIAIYTALDSVDDEASWYGYRLIAEPYYSINLNETVNVWNEWNTAAGTNQLRFFDSAKIADLYGFYGGPTLQDLQAGAINWYSYDVAYTNQAINYGAEKVKYITFQTGSEGMATFEGCIDEIVISLKSGTSLTIDLEKGTSSVNLGVNVPEITAISVSPTTWDFGDVSPGSHSDVGVSITNTGTVPVNVTTELSPAGSVFDSCLYFPWDDGLVKNFFLSNLAGGNSYSNTARLNIPRDYHAQGVETGLLVFEATVV